MSEFSLPHNHGQSHGSEDIYNQLQDSDKFDAVSDLFKQLSDPTRVRIFWLLSHREECVINISALLGMTSPAVSHHLRPMKDCGIIESRRDGKEVYYRIADTDACRLLHQVTDQILEITCPSKKLDFNTSHKEIIASVHSYLLENLNERITIEELSKKFLMNPTTLKSAFKEVYGMSIAAHINVHRMEKAAELLKGTPYSVGQIALNVGFSSQSRFTTAFKEYFGILPTEYRSLKK